MNRVVTLSSGKVMPLVGLGTWKSKPGEVAAAVQTAIQCGYRHIDAAWVYKNEDEVGAGIKAAIDAGIVTREELFVTSKLWNDFHAAADVEKAMRETLTNLKLDYLDLYLIHWPVTGVPGETLTPSIQETWGAMERVQEMGLARSIGVSNFTLTRLNEMKPYAKVFPAVNQVELHPMWRQEDLVRGCAEMGVHVTAYSPLGSPDSAEMIKHTGGSLLSHPVVTAIAEATGKSAGQVLLRWGVQRGTSVIPKSVTPSRIAENAALFDWELTAEQMARLNGPEIEQQRLVAGKFWLHENGPYRTLEELWN